MTVDVTRELAALEEAFRALARLRDEAAARSLAEVVVRRYDRLRAPDAIDERRSLFRFLDSSFGPDPAALDVAIATWNQDRSPDAANSLWRAAEAPRLDVFRAINLADDGIHTIRGCAMPQLARGVKGFRAGLCLPRCCEDKRSVP